MKLFLLFRIGCDHYALDAAEIAEVLRCEDGSFVDGGIDPGAARYLGPVRHDARGLVQWITVPALLPDDVRALLYPEDTAARDLAVSHP